MPIDYIASLRASMHNLLFFIIYLAISRNAHHVRTMRISSTHHLCTIFAPCYLRSSRNHMDYSPYIYAEASTSKRTAQSNIKYE